MSDEQARYEEEKYWNELAQAEYEHEHELAQPTHNAPNPPEEGDCIGGEGGGL